MIFSTFYPVSRGFDDIFEEFTNQAFKADENYPPYNYYTEDENDVVDIAVAGFDEKDIKVYFDEDGYLTITGSIEKEQNRDYKHRSLSMKNFKRKFRLDKHLEVKNVTLKNGILRIVMHENKVEPQLIPINTANSLENPEKIPKEGKK